MIDLAHAAPATTAAFLASLVEFVEALTVILAVGSVRGWRDAIIGAVAALLVLLILTAALGPALTLIPLHMVQIAVGGLLTLFGLRWLRKAILRAAGVLALHDEDQTFRDERAAMSRAGRAAGTFDAIAFTAAFKITMLEGAEVVFIIIAVGAGGAALIVPASLGALAALLVVVALGLIVHKPLSRVPENSLKFIVGALLSAFGAFWLGEGIGVVWPLGDGALIGLALGFLGLGVVAVRICRMRLRQVASGASL